MPLELCRNISQSLPFPKVRSLPGAHGGAGCPPVELPAVPHVAAQRPGLQAVSVAAEVFSSCGGQAGILLKPVTEAGIEENNSISVS